MGISAESIQDKESEWVAGDTIIKQMAGVGIFQYAFNLSSKVLDFDWIFVQLLLLESSLLIDLIQFNIFQINSYLSDVICGWNWICHVSQRLYFFQNLFIFLIELWFYAKLNIVTIAVGTPPIPHPYLASPAVQLAYLRRLWRSPVHVICCEVQKRFPTFGEVLLPWLCTPLLLLLAAH